MYCEMDERYLLNSDYQISCMTPSQIEEVLHANNMISNGELMSMVGDNIKMQQLPEALVSALCKTLQEKSSSGLLGILKEQQSPMKETEQKEVMGSDSDSDPSVIDEV